MSATERLRVYVAHLPAGSILMSRRVANVLNISQTSAHMALRRLEKTGEVARMPWPPGVVSYFTVKHEHSGAGHDAS